MAETPRQAARRRARQIVLMRQMKAPPWMIRHQQIGIAMGRMGMKYTYPIAKSKTQQELMLRYVIPELEKASQDD